jgi:hypothetical protein
MDHLTKIKIISFTQTYGYIFLLQHPQLTFGWFNEYSGQTEPLNPGQTEPVIPGQTEPLIPVKLSHLRV